MPADHVTLTDDAIGVVDSGEICATADTTYPNYAHALLAKHEFIARLDGTASGHRA